MRIGISINFNLELKNEGYFLELFNSLFNFKPTRIVYTKNKKKIWREAAWSDKKHLQLLGKIDVGEQIVISADGNSFFCGLTGSRHPHLTLTITQDYQESSIYSINLQNIVADKGEFVSAYIYHSDYTEVQSTTFANNIKGRNLSPDILATIKDTPYRIEYSSGFKIYDTTYNPGCKELIDYTWLIPAWKMWFGKAFYHIVPKEHILSFKKASEIKMLSEDLLYVKLFENIDQSWTKENMERQWAWREWLDFDALKKRYR